MFFVYFAINKFSNLKLSVWIQIDKINFYFSFIKFFFLK